MQGFGACGQGERVPLVPVEPDVAGQAGPSGTKRGGSWLSEEIFHSFKLRILRRHGTGTSISRATAGRPRYLI